MYVFEVLSLPNFKRKSPVDDGGIFKHKCRRRKGRPRSRWTDELEADLLFMNVRPWKVVAADRNKWKSVLGEAKVHIGL